ncbi:hypothetical protein TREMEDRAFT_64996 [Tremella mesenterica DSM 1558]|uniref:uncharacterized protein n=1 Tax=Tremella mesenterica (strain ATCC 24925 / CBS 8224 / DSM 1558 / NBRC 9311 / NRRL Y-6157 / RJB 2259-6 / UBC 559-6) TaxID=578456 RepID=UPI0003F49914|nr:uncharacterized protein TREMEDRAFT_64996 [Tremella mesenterica DSM 1558]EIW67127.1 hypothetical protein TREMEDRAFT_64996 [Tremella mesenterica DSM 1558]
MQWSEVDAMVGNPPAKLEMARGTSISSLGSAAPSTASSFPPSSFSSHSHTTPDRTSSSSIPSNPSINSHESKDPGQYWDSDSTAHVLSPKAPNGMADVESNYNEEFNKKMNSRSVSNSESKTFIPSSLNTNTLQLRKGPDNTSNKDSSVEDDGFLATVAQWGQQERSVGGRTSRLISGRYHLQGTPPPSGPPPSEPPPPLPISASLLATSTALNGSTNSDSTVRSRSGDSNGKINSLIDSVGPRTTFGRATGRLSRIAASRKTSVGAPPSGPPNTALPQIPTSPSSKTGANGLPDSEQTRRDVVAGPSGTNEHHSSPSRRRRKDSSQNLPDAVQPGHPAVNGEGTRPYAQSEAGSSNLRSDQSERTTSSAGTSKSGRTPSRLLLQDALNLAQTAVELDKTNDVSGALAMYTEAVEKLKSVMARVGIDPGKEDRGKSGKSEEEGRTLRGIHDAYVARIQLLSSMEPLISPASTSVIPRSTPVESQPSEPILGLETSFPSTSTLVPDRPPSQSPHSNMSVGTSGDRTPRPSLDDTGIVGIGNLMMSSSPHSARSYSSHSSRHPFAIAAATSSSPRLIPSAVVGSPRDHIPARSSPTTRLSTPGNGLNTGQELDDTTPREPRAPTTLPPRRESIGPNSTALDQSFTRQPLSRSRQISAQRKAQQSFGLEEELDLSDIISDPSQSNGQPYAGISTTVSQNGSARSSATGVPRAGVYPPDDRPLPPIPSSPGGQGSKLSRIASMLINNSTSNGTISQRRQSRHASESGSGIFIPPSDHSSNQIDGLPRSSSTSIPFPTVSPPPQALRSATFLPESESQPSLRLRSRSQPGNQRPSEIFNATLGTLPPLPRKIHKPSLSSHSLSSNGQRSSRLAPPLPLNLTRSPGSGTLPPLPPSARSGISNISGLSNISPLSGSLLSPLPESQPTSVISRPFHVLRTLLRSMDPNGPGAYLTSSIHVTPSVWKPSNWSKMGHGRLPAPKIQAQDVKQRCMETLVLHLRALGQVGSGMLTGPRERRYGEGLNGSFNHDDGLRRMNGGGSMMNLSGGGSMMNLSGGGSMMNLSGGGSTMNLPGSGSRMNLSSVGNEQDDERIEHLIKVLDAMEDEMDGWYKALGKAGVVVGIWKGKKTGGSNWGKLTRSMDKMGSGGGKTLESPETYVDTMAALCSSVQVIKCLQGPSTSAYLALSDKTHQAIEGRVIRIAEFVGAVLAPFVLDDFKQFFLRYLKGGVRYLEE